MCYILSEIEGEMKEKKKNSMSSRMFLYFSSPSFLFSFFFLFNFFFISFVSICTYNNAPQNNWSDTHYCSRFTKKIESFLTECHAQYSVESNIYSRLI